MDTKLLGALTAAYIFGIGGMGVVTFFVVQAIVWLKGALGGRGVWRSRYDSSRSEFDQRVNESTQGTGEKGNMNEDLIY